MKTLEQQQTEAILHMAEAMKELDIQLNLANHQLAMAQQRIADLEAQVYGGATH